MGRDHLLLANSAPVTTVEKSTLMPLSRLKSHFHPKLWGCTERLLSSEWEQGYLCLINLHVSSTQHST